MHKLFNAFLVLTVLVSGFILYTLEHATRGLERQIPGWNARPPARAKASSCWGPNGAA